MKKIILASNNLHKIQEIQEILKGFPFDIKSISEENIHVEIEEDGSTFEENAMKKVFEIAKNLKSRGEKEFIVMADDSGIEVDYLNGMPGIYSARYSGEHGNDKKNNEKLLEELKGVPQENRGAQFVCHIVLIDENGKKLSIKGEVRGRILEELLGKEGFGYDPLFFYEPLNKTFGELTGEEKNIVSHRASALRKLKDEIYKFHEV